MGDQHETYADAILTGGAGVGAYNLAEYADLFEPVAQGLETTAPEYAALARFGLPVAFGAAIGLGSGRVGRKAVEKANDGYAKIDAYLDGEDDEPDVVDGSAGIRRKALDYGVSAGAAVATYDALSYTDIAGQTAAALQPVSPEASATIQTTPALVWGGAGLLAGLGVGRAVSGVADIEGHTETVKGYMQDVRESLGDGGGYVGPAVVAAGGRLKDGYDRVASGVRPYAEKGWDTASTTASEAYDWVRDLDIDVTRPGAQPEDTETDTDPDYRLHTGAGGGIGVTLGTGAGLLVAPIAGPFGVLVVGGGALAGGSTGAALGYGAGRTGDWLRDWDVDVTWPGEDRDDDEVA